MGLYSTQTPRSKLIQSGATVPAYFSYLAGNFGWKEPYPDGAAAINAGQPLLFGFSKAGLPGHRAAVANDQYPDPVDLWHVAIDELSLLGYEYKWTLIPSEGPDDQLDGGYIYLMTRAQRERHVRIHVLFPQLNAALAELRAQYERGDIDLDQAKKARRNWLKAVNANIPATGMVSARIEPKSQGSWDSFLELAPQALTIVAVAITIATLLPAAPTLSAAVPAATGTAAADAALVEAAAAALPTATGEMASAVAALGVEAPAVSSALITAPAAGSASLLGTVSSELGSSVAGIVTEVGGTAAAVVKASAVGAVLGAVGLGDKAPDGPAPVQAAAEPESSLGLPVAVGALVLVVVLFFVGTRVNA